VPLGPPGASGAARQRPAGGRSGEAADPGAHLALGAGAALLERDPSPAPGALGIHADLLGEARDPLAGTDQPSILVERQRPGDRDAADPRVLVGMALAGRVRLGG
jgi:hypothetical protein